MDKINQWSVTVSAVSVISGILLSLIPDSKIRPAYKTLVSIVLVYSIMLPLTNSFSINFDINDYIKENYNIRDDLDKYALKSALSSAEKAIEEALNDYFTYEKIKCDFSVECYLKGEEIRVKRITVESQENEDGIKALLCELGFSEGIIEFKGEAHEQ